MATPLTPEQLHIARTLAGEYKQRISLMDMQTHWFRAVSKHDLGKVFWWSNREHAWKSESVLEARTLHNGTCVIEVNPQTGEDIS